MAKVGGTLTADTNAEVLPADGTRHNIAIINNDGAAAIYVEFGAAASTTVADDSWVIPAVAGASLFLNRGEWPEIAGSVNLKSTGTPTYVVRSNT